MENHTRISYHPQNRFYQELIQELRALRDPSMLANYANAAAMIFHQLPDLNWAGFYFFDGRELVLGPFQGRTACVRIALGRGVCGQAARERRTILVPDVHAFPGHIACDVASRSEIVVPLVKNGTLIGVMDLDSPMVGRFNLQDQMGLEGLARVLMEAESSGSRHF